MSFWDWLLSLLIWFEAFRLATKRSRGNSLLCLWKSFVSQVSFSRFFSLHCITCGTIKRYFNVLMPFSRTQIIINFQAWNYLTSKRGKNTTQLTNIGLITFFNSSTSSMNLQIFSTKNVFESVWLIWTICVIILINKKTFKLSQICSNR